MGEAKRRKKLDPNYGKVPQQLKRSNHLPDLGHWLRNSYPEIIGLIVQVNQDSGCIVSTRGSTPHLGFFVNCLDDVRRIATAEFKTEKIDDFMSSMAQMKKLGGEILIAMEIDNNKQYKAPNGDLVLPPQIESFQHCTNEDDANEFLQGLVQREKMLVCRAASSRT